MTILVAFTLAAVVTFVLRSAMTLTGTSVAHPAVAICIALVSPAVLAAMVASALLLDHGVLGPPAPAEVIAVVAALAAVRRTHNVSLALVVGFPVYWLAELLVQL